MALDHIQQAVAGTETPQTRLMDAIGKAAFRIEELASEMVKAKDEDTQRWHNLNAERQEQAKVLTELQAEFAKAKVAEDHERAMA